MSEQEKQESQKTVVAFVAGLLIGGLLVWVFGGTPETTEKTEEVSKETPSEQVETPTDTASAEPATEVNEAPVVSELPVGNADVSIKNQPAGITVSLEGATFPSDEGWIGVRDYTDGQLTGLLGVVRYSKEQGLVPESITLQRSTVAGNNYAVVFYSESGDRIFNLADDVQVGGVTKTFTAQ